MVVAFVVREFWLGRWQNTLRKLERQFVDMGGKEDDPLRVLDSKRLVAKNPDTAVALMR